MAIIVAVMIAALSAIVGFLGLYASGMATVPGTPSGVKPYVIGGFILAALIAASHWLGW